MSVEFTGYLELAAFITALMVASFGVNLVCHRLARIASSWGYWAVNLLIMPLCILAYGFYLRANVVRPDCGGEPHCWPEFSEMLQIAIAEAIKTFGSAAGFVTSLIVTFVYSRRYRSP